MTDVVARLKAKIQVGMDELERGATAAFNVEEFLANRHAENRQSKIKH